jgi:hypothetical protein
MLRRINSSTRNCQTIRLDGLTYLYAMGIQLAWSEAPGVRTGIQVAAGQYLANQQPA